MQLCRTSILCLLLAACIATQPGWAADRHRVEVRHAPASILRPASVDQQPAQALVLSGLDFSAVAPPGIRLRVIEDEPYTYALYTAGRGSRTDESVTRLVLRADLPARDGAPIGWYEAQVTLRYRRQAGADGPLAQAFNTAAYAAYRQALTAREQREALSYSLAEVRSPLGLTEPKDCLNSTREYFAYRAAAINPNAPEGAVRATPYQYIQGELKVLRLIERRECLLTVKLIATEFPHALTLTENLARCVINRLLPVKDVKARLPYLAYYPEAERAALGEGEVLDPRTADLAELPGEGCGVEPLPIQGDICPTCEGQGEGPFWPARPYADPLYIHVLAGQIADAVCSHCLMPAVSDKPEDVAPTGATPAEPATPKGDSRNDSECNGSCSFIKR